MDKYYEELFFKLAGLLGWTSVFISDGSFPGVYGHPPEAEAEAWGVKEGQRASMPNWIMDDGAAFRLAVEYDIWPFPALSNLIECTDGNGKVLSAVMMQEHTDKLTAVRVAIVKAVIAKLEGEKE